MLSPAAHPQGKDLMEPVFQLRNPLLIQICNCESQELLAGTVGARSYAAVWPRLHSASLALLSLPINGVVACAPARPNSDSLSLVLLPRGDVQLVDVGKRCLTHHVPVRSGETGCAMM